MLKLIKLSAALSAAMVIVSLPEAVFSRPLSQSSGYPVVRNSNTGSPFCYMETPRGVTLNLENLCTADDVSGSGNRTPNATANPAGANAPGATNSQGNAPNTRVLRFTGTPGQVVTPNGTNNNANINPNATSTNAGTPNNVNGATSNPNVTNTGTPNNVNGATSNPNVTNTGTSNNLSGTNATTNNQR